VWKKKSAKAKLDGASDTRLSRGRTRPGALFPVAPPAASLPPTYAATLQQIKTHLATARVRAILAANPVIIEAYWQTGKVILARQQEAGWGGKVIDRLATDLKEAFPDMNGLSVRNLLAMKVFAREFPASPIAQQPVAQLPWGHVLQIMQRTKDPAAREFYIRESLAQGWSRNILEIQLKKQLQPRAPRRTLAKISPPRHCPPPHLRHPHGPRAPRLRSHRVRNGQRQGLRRIRLRESVESIA
jgi:predicted nuclease of restriction endonuclease-like (RecB) superfamily